LISVTEFIHLYLVVLRLDLLYRNGDWINNIWIFLFHVRQVTFARVQPDWLLRQNFISNNINASGEFIIVVTALHKGLSDNLKFRLGNSIVEDLIKINDAWPSLHRRDIHGLIDSYTFFILVIGIARIL